MSTANGDLRGRTDANSADSGANRTRHPRPRIRARSTRLPRLLQRPVPDRPVAGSCLFPVHRRGSRTEDREMHRRRNHQSRGTRTCDLENTRFRQAEARHRMHIMHRKQERPGCHPKADPGAGAKFFCASAPSRNELGGYAPPVDPSQPLLIKIVAAALFPAPLAHVPSQPRISPPPLPPPPSCTLTTAAPSSPPRPAICAVSAPQGVGPRSRPMMPQKG